MVERVAESGGTDRGEGVSKAAAEVAVTAAEHADAGEREGCLAPAVVAGLVAGDLLRMGMPVELGGPGVDPLTAAEAIMTLAGGDAAAGWYATVSSAHSVLTHYLPEEGAREVFDGSAPVGCASMPRGTGELTADGLRLDSGRWPWGSAGRHASFMGANTVVGGRVLVAFLPRGDFVVEDNWDAVGLRASASGDFSVRPGAVVPPHRLVDMSPPRPRLDGPLSRFPLPAYMTYGFSAVALGNAIGAVNELVDGAGSGRPVGLSGSLAQSPLVQIDLARAEARLYSARAFLMESLRGLWDDALTGRTTPTPERARAKLAMSHAVTESAAVVDTVHTLAGGPAVMRGHPLQKRLRDAHVITQHVQVSSRTYPLYGKVRLGVELDAASWRFAI
ncbi:acyl-CoA dehydrogenase family protein [Streptomyces calidiresistens]